MIRVGLAALVATLLAPAAARAACVGRPTDAAGYQGYAYGSAEVKSHATPRVRVHWALTGTHAPDLATTRPDGVPDTVAYAAEMGETALSKYAAMGFRAVPGDTACSSNGGDDKLDIYLVAFTGADGHCAVECSGSTCSSFALVESTFSGRAYANAEEGFRTVVTHELFHAVQNAYTRGEDPYWSEGTAQWAMKTVHPELSDFERNLKGFFAEPSRSIDAPPSGPVAGYLYGSAVWPLFLELVHGAGTVRAVFEAQAAAPGPALDAVAAVLEQKGTSLAAVYPMFAAWTAATGSRAGTGGFPDAATYPSIAVAPLAEGISEITSGLSYFAYEGTLEGEREVSLDTDATRNGGVLVPLEAGKARLDRATALPAVASGDVLVVVSGVTSKKSDARFTLHIRAPERATATSDGGCSAAPAHGSGPSPLFAALGLALVARRKKQEVRSPS